MKPRTGTFWELLEQPLRGRSRVVLALLVLPLLATFAFPLSSARRPSATVGPSMVSQCARADRGRARASTTDAAAASRTRNTIRIGSSLPCLGPLPGGPIPA